MFFGLNRFSIICVKVPVTTAGNSVSTDSTMADALPVAAGWGAG